MKVAEGGEEAKEAVKKVAMAAALKAMPSRKKISDDEAKQWKKTDNIVMTVLSG